MPHTRSQNGKIRQKKRFKSFQEDKAEKDTIRGVFKDTCQRDRVSGEIAVKKTNLEDIAANLIGTQYRVEIVFTSKLGSRTEHEWRLIDAEVAKHMFNMLEEGECLNRFGPNIWRAFNHGVSVSEAPYFK